MTCVFFFFEIRFWYQTGLKLSHLPDSASRVSRLVAFGAWAVCRPDSSLVIWAGYTLCPVRSHSAPSCIPSSLCVTAVLPVSGFTFPWYVVQMDSCACDFAVTNTVCDRWVSL